MSVPAAEVIDPAPVMPREPEDGECCQSGCDPCVYDRYWDALNRYEQALAEWKNRRLHNSGNPPGGPDKH